MDCPAPTWAGNVTIKYLSLAFQASSMQLESSSKRATFPNKYILSLSFSFPSLLLPYMSFSSFPFINRILRLEEQGPVVCSLCGGRRTIPCDLCAGIGKVKRGVFNKNNSVRKDRLVGSQWTAVVPIQNRRHFLCISKRGTRNQVVATMKSTCGPQESRISIEVPIKVNMETIFEAYLKAFRAFWSSGWVSLNDLEHMNRNTTCVKCKGLCLMKCPRCEGIGQVGV
eukprot:jgi/Galph1/2514/GphlegSOOS_G1185.1